MIKLEKVLSPDGDFAGTYTSHRPFLTVGKSTVCDLIVKDPELRAKHLIISHTKDGITAKSFNLKDSYTINGKKVSGAVLLHNNDVISIGKTTIKFLAHTPLESSSSNIDFLKNRLQEIQKSQPAIGGLLNELRKELELLQIEENQDRSKP